VLDWAVIVANDRVAVNPRGLMHSFGVQDGFADQLLAALSGEYAILGPVRGRDGVGRLASIRSWRELDPESLPLIPLKKSVFPPRDLLWTLSAAGYSPPESPPDLALVGIPPCDLYALAYLDRVFADDPGYTRRRERIFLVGAPCTPSDGCFCPPRRKPPPFDLFLAEGRAWAGSAAGAELLAGLPLEEGRTDVPLPAAVTSGVAAALPEDLEERFRTSARHPLWKEIARRCLSCGACSAVCPTCYCYDVVDAAMPDGVVERRRAWDNCFFAGHALVAGGHNFRSKRADRLRFRFEHKLLGFGELRGISSCVGCGRCARACPVDIDIAAVLAALCPGGEP
jgi:sulfhydrogenase subunit beta (sulfur reductase)